MTTICTTTAWTLFVNVSQTTSGNKCSKLIMSDFCQTMRKISNPLQENPKKYCKRLLLEPYKNITMKYVTKLDWQRDFLKIK